jgi:hypothetical protein
MGIKFGEIDSDQILDNEFRIKNLEKLIQWILVNNPTLRQPSDADLKNFQHDVLSDLQKKYPKSGIKLENKE